MASENETVKDIAKEIGDAYETWKRSEIAELPTQYLMEWRDRLDVAHRRSEEAHNREVAELRECLKDAIREKCPFTRMSCKHGEPCDYECETFKWRKALREEGGAS